MLSGGDYLQGKIHFVVFFEIGSFGFNGNSLARIVFEFAAFCLFDNYSALDAKDDAILHHGATGAI